MHVKIITISAVVGWWLLSITFNLVARYHFEIISRHQIIFSCQTTGSVHNNNHFCSARFDALTAVFLKTQVFWDITRYCWTSSYQHCNGLYCFQKLGKFMPNDTASHPRRTDIWLEIPVSLTQLIFSNTTAINTVHCNSFIIRMLLCLALANIMTT
jgi:hypothetical protein